MKKIICTISMVVILFNFIFCNNVYATEQAFQGLDSITQESISPKEQESMVNDMLKAYIGNVFGGAIVGVIAVVLNLFPMLLQLGMTMLVGEGCTIEKIVFNEIDLFDINYFELNNATNNITSVLRENVAESFIVVRLIAISISLIVLIYIGIRMAISSIADEKAKYKKMFMGWVESIVLLFLMQYIISMLFYIGQRAGALISDLKTVMDASGSGTISFEQDILDMMFNFLRIKSGWEYCLYSVMYWVLIFIQTKFFVMYFKRLVVTGFLILIAPAVTVTYPIDKAGDGKAQAFSIWFAELMVNILIQPIHAMIYLVFMYTAGEIAKHSMLIALIFLLSMTKVEKYVLRLFNLRNVTSLNSVDEERKKGI